MKLWREDPPVQNDEGEIIKGGMFGHQKDWWNLPNYIKALIAGYDEPFIQKGCFECLLNTESGRSENSSMIYLRIYASISPQIKTPQLRGAINKR